MKTQCSFCKSDDAETLLVDSDVIVICSVCGSESVVEYPESINYFDSEVNDDYASYHKDNTIRFHV